MSSKQKSNDFALKVELALAQIFQQVDKRFFYLNLSPILKNKKICLKGYVHFPQMKSAISKYFKKYFENHSIDTKGIQVLTELKPLRFAQVNVRTATVYREPSENSEVDTQEMYGRYLRLFYDNDDWSFSQGVDGYLGWINSKCVIEKTPDDYLRWLNGLRCIFRVPITINGVDFPAGAEFAYDRRRGILLPDNKHIQVPEDHITILEPKKRLKAEQLIKSANVFKGTKYLWGGKTDWGIDCSGFMQLIYHLNGIAIPRDANQQVNIGYGIGHFADHRDLLPGDLIFFMNDNAKVYHVGMSLGGKKFIHSYGKKGVSVCNFPVQNEKDKDAMDPSYRTNYVFARRILL